MKLLGGLYSVSSRELFCFRTVFERLLRNQMQS